MRSLLKRFCNARSAFLISPAPLPRCWTRWGAAGRYAGRGHCPRSGRPTAAERADRRPRCLTRASHDPKNAIRVSRLPDLVRTLAAFAVVLGVLVFVHEFGHYLAARWRGVHVEVFSIGFGQRWPLDRRHGTRWKIGLAAAGRLREAARPGTAGGRVGRRCAPAWIPGRTFHEKSVLSRAIIVAAGPIANFVLARCCSPCCSPRWAGR